jgi:hypothetical protein
VKDSSLIGGGAHRAEIHLFDVMMRRDLHLSLFNLCGLLADILILLSSSNSLLNSTSSNTGHASFNPLLFLYVVRCNGLALAFLDRTIHPLNFCLILLPSLFLQRLSFLR